MWLTAEEYLDCAMHIHVLCLWPLMATMMLHKICINILLATCNGRQHINASFKIHHRHRHLHRHQQQRAQHACMQHNTSAKCVCNACDCVRICFLFPLSCNTAGGWFNEIARCKQKRNLWFRVAPFLHTASLAAFYSKIIIDMRDNRRQLKATQ